MSDQRPDEPLGGGPRPQPGTSPWSADVAGNGGSSPVPAAPPVAPPPAQGSPWWATDAPRDPWRDPGSAPAWIAPAPPPAPPPPLPPDTAGPPRRVGGLLSVALIAALLAGTLGGALGFAAAARFTGSDVVDLGGRGTTGSPALANRAPASVAGIARRVQPSVVSIEISAAGKRGNGSGFVVSPNGYIITNNHVAAPAANGGALRVVFQDGTSSPGKIVGRDPNSDIAVLKIERTKLPAVRFGDSDQAVVGDPVVAFGSPLGLQGTVTSGIISAVDRPVVTGGENGDMEAYMAALQTDAAINPGNSGGPLVDGSGRVVGVNSAIATLAGAAREGGSIGLGFSIPINQAKRIAEQLIATGRAKRTIIGATLDQSYVSATGGVRLEEVPAGPARTAGLRAGDVITAFNGRRVSDPTDLIAFIRKFPAGAQIPVAYNRGGTSSTVTVTLTETN
ncbi:MAG TPA: trypsin-like peptidase domain-containing protein [Mycobacteriales bacterium]|nr:trypsin-like peptidase domain-containing protein [Mycobacteriales bacterium]